MCENGREGGSERERERRVCVNVRETTALGCWRHAPACVCVCARVCRYVCDSCTQHASVNMWMSVCVCLFTHTLEGCLSGPHI